MFDSYDGHIKYLVFCLSQDFEFEEMRYKNNRHSANSKNN